MKLVAILTVTLLLTLGISIHSFAQQATYDLGTSKMEAAEGGDKAPRTTSNYQLLADSMSNGGGVTTGNGYTLRSTLGLPTVAQMSDGSYLLTSGFGFSRDKTYFVYLPMIVR